MTIPFTFLGSRAEIAAARPPFGSCMYLGCEQDGSGRWAIEYPGATINFRGRIGKHDPAWEGYWIAYPGQDLADLIYPHALDYYRRESPWLRRSYLWALSPEEAAAHDVRVVGPEDRGTGPYGIHYRLEHLVAKYIVAQGATLEHWGGDTEHFSRHLYMQPLTFRFDGAVGIVSAEA